MDGNLNESDQGKAVSLYLIWQVLVFVQYKLSFQEIVVVPKKKKQFRNVIHIYFLI